VRPLSRRQFLGAAAGVGAAAFLAACRVRPVTGQAGVPPTLTFLNGTYTTAPTDPNRVKQISGKTSAWSNDINWSVAGAVPPLVNNAPAQIAKQVDYATAGVYGADMGAMWDDGQGHVITTFGDTWGSGWTGPGPAHTAPADYRENVGARSSNRDLTQGVLFDSWLHLGYGPHPAYAAPLVTPNTLGVQLKSKTPVAGCSIPHGDGGRAQLMLVSMIKSYAAWNGPTGASAFSTLVASTDGGESWVDLTKAFDAPVWWNDSTSSKSFQQGAFVVPDDGYVYWFGTRNVSASGAGPVQVARAPASTGSALARSGWRYWNGTSWVTDVNQAVTVIPAPADLISIQWNDYLGCWLMAFVSSSPYGQYIGWRGALNLMGPWSDPVTMAVPSLGAYCAQIHPWSSGPDLYFTVTMEQPYAVFLLHATITTPPPPA
jgi:hypothetical protein